MTMTDESTPTEAQLRLRPPAHRVEARAMLWWALQSAAFAVPLLVGGGVAYWQWEAGRPLVLLALIALSVFAVAVIAVEPFWRYAVHRWETTDDAVYAVTGWVVREWRAAPISRIQTVDAVRGPVEQLLGLATLRVTTASSKGAIDIGGLDHQVAADVAERLTQITQATEGDAT